jgi:transketolase
LRRVERPFRRLPRRLPGPGRRVRAPHGRRTAGRLGRPKSPPYIAKPHRKGRDHRHPQGQQNSHRSLRTRLPEIFGGSADLAGSNLTLVKGSKGVTKTEGGNYCYYGVREFGMTAIANGIALHGGLIPYTATFLVFSDYARNAMRMAALMKQRQIMVTPTTPSASAKTARPTSRSSTSRSLRIIPNMDVWRPADTTETAVAWTAAVDRTDGPSLLPCRARTCRP